MSQYTYLSLPIDGDEGFPQAFRLTFNGRTYQILLYANLPEELVEAAEDQVFDLPAPHAFMVMRVARETTGQPEVIFHRKLVPNIDYEAQELAFRFDTMRVARRNLNGAGSFGSQVTGGVAARWAS
jgi:hypothetical protein